MCWPYCDFVVGEGYVLRRMTYPELRAEGTALWGKKWQVRFREVAKVTVRTMARWKSAGIVTNANVTSMMVAFREMKRNGLNQEVDWER